MKNKTSFWDKHWNNKIDFRLLSKRWKLAFLIWAILSIVPFIMNMVYISAPYSARISAMPWLIASIVSILAFAILCIGILVENHKNPK